MMNITVCPSCNASLSFRYSSAMWHYCESCGDMISREDGTYVKCDKPPEDLTPFKIGIRGRFKLDGTTDRPFELTGRVRYIFNDGAYLNWWHCEYMENRSVWIAESYGNIFLMIPADLMVSVASIEKNEPGEYLTIAGKKYQLISFASVSDFTAEGEFPAPVLQTKFIWVEFMSDDEQALDVQIFNRTTTRFFTGKQTTIEELNITGIRRFNGWN